jgi:hypothetical protein
MPSRRPPARRRPVRARSAGERGPGQIRVLPPNLVDQRACYDLGTADAGQDKAAGAPPAPQVTFAAISREHHACAAAYVDGYNDQPFHPH